MTPVGLYVNDFFEGLATVYPTQPQTAPHSTLANVISTTSQVLSAMAGTTDTVYGRNIPSSNHCLSNMTYAQCQQYFNSYSNSRVLEAYYNTSVGMRCLEGDCGRVGGLANYYLQFKLKANYIRYVQVTFGTNKVIAPAL